MVGWVGMDLVKDEMMKHIHSKSKGYGGDERNRTPDPNVCSLV
jgi:hypothetical protein